MTEENDTLNQSGADDSLSKENTTNEGDVTQAEESLTDEAQALKDELDKIKVEPPKQM